MTAANLAVVFSSAVSLILLVWILSCLWPAQRIDIFRQELFALRDEMFDFAANGSIAFDHPAYALLRQLMNGFLRYAHNITPYRILASFIRWKLLARQPSGDWSAAWEKAVNSVEDEKTRTMMHEFYRRLALLVGTQFLLSPGLFVPLTLLILIALIHHQWLNLKNAYEALWFIEEEAVAAANSAS